MNVSMPARKYAEWKPGKWSSTLPQIYFNRMTALINGVTDGWFSERDIAEGYDQYIKARHIFGRMEIAETRVIPWIETAVGGLAGKTVLEVGCGSGSATAPLAMKAARVHAFDLADDQVSIARERCDLLGLRNVSLFSRGVEWVHEYARDPACLAPQVDVIVAYALLEHLTPEERLSFLVGAWRHLQKGGHLVIIETPNRLYWFDWHSAQMPFVDQLPHELAFLWNEFSPRGSIPFNIRANSLESAMRCDVESWYRFGRGASFHEFHLALGSESYEIIDMPVIEDRPRFAVWNEQDIETLKRQLLTVTPAVHPAFAYPCLDLAVQKTGDPRLRL